MIGSLVCSPMLRFVLSWWVWAQRACVCIPTGTVGTRILNILAIHVNKELLCLTAPEPGALRLLSLSIDVGLRATMFAIILC